MKKNLYKSLLALSTATLFTTAICFAQTTNYDANSYASDNGNYTIIQAISDNINAVTQSPDVQTLSTTQITGKVTKIEGSTITIQDSNGNTQSVNIPSNVQVLRDSKTAGVSDIHLNDNLSVKTGSDGTVLAVNDSSSADLSSTLMWLIPIIVGSIIIISLLYFIISKSNKGHIKTSFQHFNR